MNFAIGILKFEWIWNSLVIETYFNLDLHLWKLEKLSFYYCIWLLKNIL